MSAAADPPASDKPVMETIGVRDAAALLRLSEDALMRKARAGIVPGAKIGRQWVFVRADLVELIREQSKARARRPIDVQRLRIANPFEKYSSQLARQIESERRNWERRQKAPARRVASKG